MHGIIKNGIYWKKEKEKDKLRIGGGSWSINLSDVDLANVHTVVFCTEKAHYVIEAIDALAHGFERTLGGEDKLVVPLKHWEVKSNDSTRETTSDN